MVPLKNRIRLRKLCSQAMKETEPHRLAGLLGEIDDILSETLQELSAMLRDVEQVLKKREKAARIHLT